MLDIISELVKSLTNNIQITTPQASALVVRNTFVGANRLNSAPEAAGSSPTGRRRSKNERNTTRSNSVAATETPVTS